MRDVHVRPRRWRRQRVFSSNAAAQASPHWRASSLVVAAVAFAACGPARRAPRHRSLPATPLACALGAAGALAPLPPCTTPRDGRRSAALGAATLSMLPAWPRGARGLATPSAPLPPRLPAPASGKLSGAAFPLTVGLGTCLVADGSVEAQVSEALAVGYRLIDTAEKYANEGGIGRALKRAFAGGLSREEVYVTTKVWPSNSGFKEVVACVRASAEQLGLASIDLVMPHWPTGPGFETNMDWRDTTKGREANALNRKETWRALESLKREGLVKEIGVSNYNERHLRELLEYAEERPTVSQFEVHPFNTRDNLVAFCEASGIRVEAYSPLGGKGNQKQVTDTLFREPAIKRIAVAYGKTPAQVILRWHLQRGITPIPKASSRKRLQENYDVFGFELGLAEMKQISSLDKKSFVVMDSEVLL